MALVVRPRLVISASRHARRRQGRFAPPPAVTCGQHMSGASTTNLFDADWQTDERFARSIGASWRLGKG
jgi:hypothetical protein